MRPLLKPRERFYDADEFHRSWMPTLRAMWSPQGQHVMLPPPGPPYKRYGLGAVNDYTGDTVGLFRRRKRRREGAELLQALLDRHPTGTIDVAWDNADTHADAEIEAIVRATAGRVVLLYLPTYSPGLNPIAMLWRQFRREVPHCELFVSLEALVKAAHTFFDRYNQCPHHMLSIIGAHAASLSWLYLDFRAATELAAAIRTKEYGP
jgi:hypothetical protein